MFLDSMKCGRTDDDFIYHVLSAKDCLHHASAVHHVVGYGRADTMLSDEQRFKILKSKDKQGLIPPHLAFVIGQNDIIDIILSSLLRNEQVELLLKPEPKYWSQGIEANEGMYNSARQVLHHYRKQISQASDNQSKAQLQCTIYQQCEMISLPSSVFRFSYMKGG